MHHIIWKILFVLDAYEYLEIQEGKIRKCLFFYAKIFWNISVGHESKSKTQYWKVILEPILTDMDGSKFMYWPLRI